MNRAKSALYLTGAGWSSGFLAFVFAFASRSPSAMETALFFGPLIGLLLHGAAVVVATIALVRPHPGTLRKRPAVIALLGGLLGLLAALLFATFWVAVASHGGA